MSSNMRYTLFFISNTFTSNARLKLAKNQANANQHPKAELFFWKLFILHPRYHPKIIGHILKNEQKNSVSAFMSL